MKKNIYRVSPFHHNVYEGWMYFWDKIGVLYRCIPYEVKSFGKQILLERKKTFRNSTNSFSFYKNPHILDDKDTVIIVWDIFTNSLSFTLKKWKWEIIYYSEFFSYQKSWFKKNIFYVIAFLFFRNKKILVPTQLAYDTFSKISNQVFYLPQIYHRDIQKNKNNSKKIKCLFVGRDYFAKNIDFMIQNIIELAENLDISLTLVWDLDKEKYYTHYWTYFDNGTLEILGFLDQNALDETYLQHDILICPSLVEPIWSVVMEWMSKWCAILVSDTTAAESYVQHKKNGYIFELSDKTDFKNWLIDIKNNLSVYKDNSYQFVKNHFWYKNEDLLEKIEKNFYKFIDQ